MQSTMSARRAFALFCFPRSAERERGVEEEMEEVRVSFLVWINLGESSLSFLFITSSCLTLSLLSKNLTLSFITRPNLIWHV